MPSSDSATVTALAATVGFQCGSKFAIDIILAFILTEDVEIATSIWISLNDPEKSMAEVAEDLWDHYDHEFGTDYSGLFSALSHESLATLFSLYICDSSVGEDMIDSGWLGRQGSALALHVAADVLRTKDLLVVITFLISRALGRVRVLAFIVKLFSTSNAVASLTKHVKNVAVGTWNGFLVVSLNDKDRSYQQVFGA
ncbi:unnamed protein product [Lactuca virosa]|uniref:Uncharacterized protein n=1 Tax=Lactuca virosa TaxID=75947 RepID=A0AAU9N6U8_9ASTR|nr:unnamed protein product [Lactuca virosa]